MKPGAKLLLAEMIVPPPNVPDFAKLLDLEMLVMTQGGFERTQAQYQSLYEQAGLRFTRLIDTPAPMKIVEGVR